jgi:hypothetical protein
MDATMLAACQETALHRGKTRDGLTADAKLEAGTHRERTGS